jgi:hypothetical protein
MTKREAKAARKGAFKSAGPKLRELAPLTAVQEGRIAYELRWLERIVPAGPLDETMALKPKDDPFNLGQPMRINRAKWFAQLWNTFGFPHGVHLRRIHYALVGLADVPTPELTGRSRSSYMRWRGSTTGMPVFVNTDDCWRMLTDGGRDARYLGLVPANAFVDRRNDEAQIFLFGEPELPVASPVDGQPFDILGGNWLYPPGWQTEMEDAPKIPQAYHVEVWAEKTSMNDILVPLCERLGVNLVTGAGHLSLTVADDLIGRIERSGRPTRVLQIVDADTFGKDMPPAMARKIEFRMHQVERDYGAKPDIQLRRIVLTPEQIEEYQLPASPEDGVSVELDALEANHPGVFGQIVEEEISRYLDPNLDDKVQIVFDAFNHSIEDANDAVVTLEEQDEIEDLEEQRKALAAEFDAKLAALNERAKELFAAIAERRDQRIADGDAPEFEFDRAEIEPAGEEDDDALYDSGRDYVEQLERYKEYKGEL